jgi:hypothetical protein
MSSAISHILEIEKESKHELHRNFIEFLSSSTFFPSACCYLVTENI